MIDSRRVDVFRIRRAVDGLIAGRIQLPVPVVPSEAVRIDAGVKVGSVPALRGKQDESRAFTSQFCLGNQIGQARELYRISAGDGAVQEDNERKRILFACR